MHLIAAVGPMLVSEITDRVPSVPRSLSEPGNMHQKLSASLSPGAMPSTLRYPRALILIATPDAHNTTCMLRPRRP